MKPFLIITASGPIASAQCVEVTEESLAQAIRDLDVKKTLQLHRDRLHFLHVMRVEGGYIVGVEDGGYINAWSKGRTGALNMEVAGQRVSFPAKYCLAESEVQAVAKEFFESGRLSDICRWT